MFRADIFPDCIYKDSFLRRVMAMVPSELREINQWFFVSPRKIGLYWSSDRFYSVNLGNCDVLLGRQHADTVKPVMQKLSKTHDFWDRVEVGNNIL